VGGGGTPPGAKGGLGTGTDPGGKTRGQALGLNLGFPTGGRGGGGRSKRRVAGVGALGPFGADPRIFPAGGDTPPHTTSNLRPPRERAGGGVRAGFSRGGLPASACRRNLSYPGSYQGGDFYVKKSGQKPKARIRKNEGNQKKPPAFSGPKGPPGSKFTPPGDRGQPEASGGGRCCLNGKLLLRRASL